MSDENHEEMSPLHRLTRRIEHRLEIQERCKERHPDPVVRGEAKIRFECYQDFLSELRHTHSEVAKSQVDRIVAVRAKVTEPIKPIV